MGSVNYYLSLLEANGTQPYVQLAKELRKLPELTNATAVAKITYLALNATNLEVREAFELMIKGGTPDSTDFLFSVPTWNVQLWGLYELAKSEEFTRDDTLALVIPIADGLFRTIGDNATLEQLNTDARKLLRLGRELAEWQRSRGYAALVRLPIEAQLCWANRAPGAFVREFYDDASIYYGSGSLGNRNPYNPIEYSVFSFRPSKQRYPVEAYQWYATDPDTRKEMWRVGLERGWDNRDYAIVDRTLEEFFWFQTRSNWDYVNRLLDKVDGVATTGGFLMNVNYNWRRFRSGQLPIGTSNAAMVFMSEFLNAMGVPSTIAWRHATEVRQKEGRDSLAEHGHPLYYNPPVDKWEAYWKQYTKPSGIETNVSLDEPHQLIIVRPPTSLPKFLFQRIVAIGVTEGNSYYAINKSLAEIQSIILSIASHDMQRWLLYS